MSVEYQHQVAYVDTGDSCHLRCTTCVRGLRVMPNTSAHMPLDQFRRIVDKLKDEGYPAVGLFNWTEPFLNKRLQDYIAAVKARDLTCWLSSTLSLPKIKNLESALLAGIDNFLISISGMDQQTHEINHVNGRLEWTLRHARSVGELIRKHNLPTVAALRFLKFSYNQHHVQAARDFAEDAGLQIDIAEAFGDPLSPTPVVKMTNQRILARIKAVRPQDSDVEKACPLLFDQIAIDSKGDAYLCCAVPYVDAVRIGAYLDLDANEILRRRFKHAYCPACLVPRRTATERDRERMREAGIAAA